MASPNEKRPGTSAKGRPLISNIPSNNGSATIAQPASIDLILTRLERVKPYGAGYMASCPAHTDRTASLSLCMGDSGAILLNCFAGCSAHDVLTALGLTFADLFPRRLLDSTPEQRRELHALALRTKLKAAGNVLDLEARVVLIAAGDIERGKILDTADHDRLAVACERIRDARVAIAGRV